MDRDGTVIYGVDGDSSSSEDNGHGDADMQHMGKVPDAVPMHQHVPVTGQQGPVIDAEGFVTVQRPGKQRAVRTH